MLGAFSSTLCASASKVAPKKVYIVVYTLAMIGAAARKSSDVMTLSALMQFFALSLLVIQTVSSGSTKGISANSLKMDALALVFRLSGTVWLEGYLPVDYTGDWIYQVIEICSLLLCVWLLRELLYVKRYIRAASSTCDVFPVRLSTGACLALAAVLHADMHEKPVFDTLWMASIFTSVVAVLPQYLMILKEGGKVEALISHNIAALAVSRAMSFMFMWWARFEIECKHWIPGINHSSIALIIAHALHLVLLADFAYYYVKTMLLHGLDAQLELPTDACCFV